MTKIINSFTAKPIDEMQTTNGGIVKLVGAELGVEAFGIQAFDYPPDFGDYPEHDHAEAGHEEVYVVLAGAAEFEVGGERVSLEPGGSIRVSAETKRKIWPGPAGARILTIGATPGEPYERPEGLSLRAVE